jgi:hypothetical protein
MFRPIAISGFDNTTRRRLRIPIEIIQQHGALKAGEKVLLIEEQRLFLEPFFSTREFGLFLSIFMAPFQTDGKIHGLFIVASEDSDGISDGYNSIQNLIMENQAALRQFYVDRINSLPPYSQGETDKHREELLDHFSDQIENKECNIFVFNIELNKILAAVRPNSEFIDDYKFREDILRILHSLTAASGIFYSSDEIPVLMGIPSAAVHDKDFLAHHILLSLKDFFPSAHLTLEIFNSIHSVAFSDFTFDSFLSVM